MSSNRPPLATKLSEGAVVVYVTHRYSSGSKLITSLCLSGVVQSSRCRCTNLNVGERARNYGTTKATCLKS